MTTKHTFSTNPLRWIFFPCHYPTSWRVIAGQIWLCRQTDMETIFSLLHNQCSRYHNSQLDTFKSIQSPAYSLGCKSNTWRKKKACACRQLIATFSTEVARIKIQVMGKVISYDSNQHTLSIPNKYLHYYCKHRKLQSH